MSEQLEKRITTLEVELAHIKAQLKRDPLPESKPWWEENLGKFANDPTYDEAMELGRAYRESLRPEDADQPTAADMTINPRDISPEESTNVVILPLAESEPLSTSVQIED